MDTQSIMNFISVSSIAVGGWFAREIWGAEQVASIEAGLATNIANQVNPPTVTPPLPWQS